MDNIVIRKGRYFGVLYDYIMSHYNIVVITAHLCQSMGWKEITLNAIYIKKIQKGIKSLREQGLCTSTPNKSRIFQIGFLRMQLMYVSRLYTILRINSWSHHNLIFSSSTPMTILEELPLIYEIFGLAARND